MQNKKEALVDRRKVSCLLPVAVTTALRQDSAAIVHVSEVTVKSPLCHCDERLEAIVEETRTKQKSR